MPRPLPTRHPILQMVRRCMDKLGVSAEAINTYVEKATPRTSIESLFSSTEKTEIGKTKFDDDHRASAVFKLVICWLRTLYYDFTIERNYLFIPLMCTQSRPLFFLNYEHTHCGLWYCTFWVPSRATDIDKLEQCYSENTSNTEKYSCVIRASKDQMDTSACIIESTSNFTSNRANDIPTKEMIFRNHDTKPPRNSGGDRSRQYKAYHTSIQKFITDTKTWRDAASVGFRNNKIGTDMDYSSNPPVATSPEIQLRYIGMGRLITVIELIPLHRKAFISRSYTYLVHDDDFENPTWTLISTFTTTGPPTQFLSMIDPTKGTVTRFERQASIADLGSMRIDSIPDIPLFVRIPTFYEQWAGLPPHLQHTSLLEMVHCTGLNSGNVIQSMAMPLWSILCTRVQDMCTAIDNCGYHAETDEDTLTSIMRSGMIEAPEYRANIHPEPSAGMLVSPCNLKDAEICDQTFTVNMVIAISEYPIRSNSPDTPETSNVVFASVVSSSLVNARGDVTDTILDRDKRNVSVTFSFHKNGFAEFVWTAETDPLRISWCASDHLMVLTQGDLEYEFALETTLTPCHGHVGCWHASGPLQLKHYVSHRYATHENTFVFQKTPLHLNTETNIGDTCDYISLFHSVQSSHAVVDSVVKYQHKTGSESRMHMLAYGRKFIQTVPVKKAASKIAFHRALTSEHFSVCIHHVDYNTFPEYANQIIQVSHSM